MSPKAQPVAQSGKFPFSDGSVIAKEAFADNGGKPGEKGNVCGA